MNLPRRQFLKQSTIGVGGLLLGSYLAEGAEAVAGGYDPFEMVPLGKTQLKLSRFTLGTGVHGGNRESNATRMGRKKFHALVHGTYERGVRTFDLADIYGTHPFFTSALKDLPRDSYQIVSKIWFHQGGIPESERPDADVVVKRFLKELQTDRIDLILIHCLTSSKWPTEMRKQMDILAGLKAKGVVGAHGVSIHSLPALEAAATEPWVDSVHTRINPFGMSMDDSPEKVAPVIKKIHDAGKGVVGMKIVGEGRLRNDSKKLDQSVSYVLGLGTVDILSVGCESLEQVDNFAARVRRVPVPSHGVV